MIVAALASAAALSVAEPATEAGVRQAEGLWSEAFVTGDEAALDALLDRDYVSVTATGEARPKARIIELAKTYAAKNPGQHAQPLAATSTVRVIGRSALVQHHSPQGFSMDLFYYAGGRWKAWYSQHAAPPAPVG